MINRRGFIVGLSSYAPCAVGVNVIDLGAVGDGVKDDTQAFKDALDVGGDIYVPPGTYVLKETLNVKKPINMRGPSGTMAGVYDATLVFPEGVPGIIFHFKDTYADSSGSPFIVPVGDSSSGSCLEHLSIQGGQAFHENTSDGRSHGIWIKSVVSISNVKVGGFWGDGIHVNATAQTQDPYLRGGANTFFIENVRSFYNGGNGFLVSGSDANSGLIQSCDSSLNLGSGFLERSFLGNTYIACHAGSNSGRPYETDSRNGRNLFLNCYSESDQQPSKFVAPTIIIGGLHGAGISDDSFGFHLSASTAQGKATRFSVTSDANSSRPFDSSFSRKPNESITWTVDGDHPAGTAFAWDEKMGCWVFRHAGLGSRTPIKVTTQLNTITAGRSAPLQAGEVIIGRDGFFYGQGAYVRKIASGAAAPTSNEWCKGDIVNNANPKAGGNVGWICVEAGSPGTWKPFGVIGE